MIRNVGLIAFSDGGYLVQTRETSVKKFKARRYPFVFPGTFSLFGGAIEDNESPREGLEREINEELPGLKLPSKLEHRVYNLREQIDKILKDADEVFNGNVLSFLGFDLDSCVPQCVLGKMRGEKMTYREYLSMATEDNYYVANINQVDLRDITTKEGEKLLWLPHQAVRSLVMVPADKLAILDDLTKRIKSGEIVLR